MNFHENPANPFSLVKRQEWFKWCSTKFSQNILTWNYILFTVSYQNTLLKPENPNQNHMTSGHKDVRYVIKTLGMPQIHQLCNKDINYATKTSVMPRRHQSTTKTGCKDTNVTKTMTSGWVIIRKSHITTQG